MAASPRLRLIALTATGVDNVDVAAAREAGIAVANLRDYCTPSVVQHVFAVLLSLTHRLPEYDRLTKTGEWGRADRFSVFPYPIRERMNPSLSQTKEQAPSCSRMPMKRRV